MGSESQNSTFPEHGHVAYQIKRISIMQQHGCKYFAYIPPQTLGMGSVGQNSTFSEHGHISYQIKENHECNNKVLNILPVDTPPPSDPRDGVSRSKINFCELGHVAYQIEENLGYSNMVENISLADPYPPPTLGMGSVGQN